MRSFLGRGKTLQAGLTVCCLIAFVLFGYDQGVFGGILENEDWLKQFNHPSDSETGIIVSCYNLGCFAGCILNYMIGERLGRRRTIWLAMAFVLVGAILQTTAFTVPHLIVGRLVTGCGTGIKTSTVPMYQAELCDQHKRGRLVSAEVLFVGVGIVVAYWFDFGMSFVGGSIAWRLPIAVQMIFAIVVVALVLGLPESPRWLYKHGKSAEALDVLCRVYDREPTDEYIIAERDAILGAIELESRENTSRGLLSIFRNDRVKTRQRVILAWLVQFMNQAGGINLVVYYAPSVLVQNVGLSPKLAQILGGCINMMFMFGSIIPSFYLDRMGRRKTMMAGCAGLSLCMLMISALLSRGDMPNGHTYSSGAVAFFFLYMLIFGMSVNCVPWVYVPEILPLDARTRGTAVGISSNWLWNFTVVMITPVIIRRLHWKAYLIFMVTNALFVPAFYFFFPETSNLRLEDIDYVFSRSGNPVKNAQQVAAELKQHGHVVDLDGNGNDMSSSHSHSEEKAIREVRKEDVQV
ncbi:Putative Sugar transporter STL1 [Penicillium brasilianum]|uniref:Putative Sugar transporter STL1 n=1 Tax=Penicillium brasilianum TaxID=104259 RepID=A0A0F7TJP4_PENBI|nr:Putative Sugar transporter STL1 [Penicillium brasilianum]